MEELEKIGQRIRAERIAQRMRQKDLAAKAGIGLVALQSLEKGDSVRTNTLVRVLKGLGMASLISNALPREEISPIALRKLQKARPRRVRV